jgi:hypothetical protein
VSNQLPDDLVSIGLGILIFCQNLGGGVFLTAAQSIFSNGLRDNIIHNTPDVDPDLVLVAGATGFRQVISQEDLPGILSAYSTSIDRIMYLGVAISAVSVITSFGMGWKNIMKSKDETSDKEKGDKVGISVPVAA